MSGAFDLLLPIRSGGVPEPLLESLRSLLLWQGSDEIYRRPEGANEGGTGLAPFQVALQPLDQSLRSVPGLIDQVGGQPPNLGAIQLFFSSKRPQPKPHCPSKPLSREAGITVIP